METQVTSSWAELVRDAQNGAVDEVAAYLDGDNGDAAALIRGLLIYESDPEAGKDCFTRAARSLDVDLANLAAIYEARAYEYLAQPDEGRDLIREVLKRPLSPALRGHALYVLACYQGATPKRALSTLDAIEVDQLMSAGLKGRVFTVRGRMQTSLEKFDSALIEYAGAAVYFEEAGHVQGVAHAHNNRASVYRRLKRYADAHAEVDQALGLVSRSDPFLPEFLDQKARIYIDERKFAEALNMARRAAALLENSGKHNVLCEVLCTSGTASAGLKDYPAAGAAFARAKEIADDLSDAHLLFQVALSRRDAAHLVYRHSEVEMAEMALRLSDGSYRAAAKMVGLTHTGIIKLLARNCRQWKPKKPKTLISKSHK